MLTCRRCGKQTVQQNYGPPTCSLCKKENRRIVAARYARTPKRKETRRIYAQQEYVKQIKIRYSKTDKGKEILKRVRLKYSMSLHGKATIDAYRQREKSDPILQMKKRQRRERYRNSEKGRAEMRRYDAERRGAVSKIPNSLTSSEWIEIMRAHCYRCHYCQRRTKLTLDHVIPLSRGGTHTKENIVPACQSCNSKKHTAIIPITELFRR